MQDISLRGSTITGLPQVHWQVSHDRIRWQDKRFDQPKDHRFVALMDAYRDSGGLAAFPEFLTLCRRHCGADVATVARWIVERAVVCFEWQSQTWFPRFQYHATDVSPSVRLHPLLMELAVTYNPWEVAHWFVVPNLRLGGRTPVSLLDSDLCAVLCAAQTLPPPDAIHPLATQSPGGSELPRNSDQRALGTAEQQAA